MRFDLVSRSHSLRITGWRFGLVVVIGSDVFAFALFVNAAWLFVELADSGP